MHDVMLCSREGKRECPPQRAVALKSSSNGRLNLNRLYFLDQVRYTSCRQFLSFKLEASISAPVAYALKTGTYESKDLPTN